MLFKSSMPFNTYGFTKRFRITLFLSDIFFIKSISDLFIFSDLYGVLFDL